MIYKVPMSIKNHGACDFVICDFTSAAQHSDVCRDRYVTSRYYGGCFDSCYS